MRNVNSEANGGNSGCKSTKLTGVGGEDGEGLEWDVRIRPPSLSAKQGLEGGGQSTKCGAALVAEGALGDSMMWVIGGNRSSVALAARVSHVVSHR
jgi:hypothetical protein